MDPPHGGWGCTSGVAPLTPNSSGGPETITTRAMGGGESDSVEIGASEWRDHMAEFSDGA
jgi:hypothetical protein